MKYKFVIDIMPDSAFSVDVRDDGHTIGHLVLTQTGLRWAKPNQALADAKAEMPWAEVPEKFTERN